MSRPVYPFRRPPYQLRILMLTDGSGSYVREAFGLSTLVALLEQPARPYMRVTVTKAHRESYGSPDVANFRFEPDTLLVDGVLQYDEIWLFGTERHLPPNVPLSDDEVARVAAFMNAGGGVFATGDHESMGYALAGRLPRVRTMRSWWFPVATEVDYDAFGTSPDGFAQPVAPSFGGPRRHDTLVASADDAAHPSWYEFNDQSDGTPQQIAPTMFTRQFGFEQARYPHPLLCGPNGVINILPDHPHEGDCHAPNVTDAGLLDPAPPAAGAAAGDFEYPTVSGHQELPLVVATGTITPAHETEPPTGGGQTNAKPPTIGGHFGVIAAYDGHNVDVGRVSVDSTWHHFFDINLVAATVPPPWTGVLGADPLGAPLNPAIIEYYRNIATWLAPPPAQLGMLTAGLIWLLNTNPLNEEIRPGKLSDAYLLYIGTVARDALGRLAGQCQTTTFVWNALKYGFFDREWPIPIPIGPGPWFAGSSPAVDPVVLSQHVLGTIIGHLTEQVRAPHLLELDETVELMPRILATAVPRAIAAYGARLAKVAGDLAADSALLDRSIATFAERLDAELPESTALAR